MASLSEKILIELENIDKLLVEMPPHYKLPYLLILELAGVAALLHNFYNAIENILKQILIAKDIHLPAGHSWLKKWLNYLLKKKLFPKDVKIIWGNI